MSEISPITTPDDGALDRLCEALAERAPQWRSVSQWPAESLRLCADGGVFRWFLPVKLGGLGWSDIDQTRGYLRLSAADLTTTFIITQYMGAVRRIASSENRFVSEQWLDRLVRGDALATVGISHLTTSRRHLDRPILMARQCEGGYLLDGQAPWVTAAPHADLFVVGASLDDGREVLVAVPGDSEGITAGGGAELVALSASCTDPVQFESVHVERSMVLAGPQEKVLQSGVGARTGGLQTSTLAIGLSRAAITYLAGEAERREDLRPASDELAAEVEQLEAWLLRAAGGDASCDASDIRGAANRLVMRSTQAAMTAAKGAGFIEGHPVGRWCREALFFLVWSCPQPIAQAHLCELAGIS
jgi:alkylation response protein AidB-like acyl-CoA dehydrogenase